MGTKCTYFRKNLTDTYLRNLKSKTDLQITDIKVPGFHLRFSSATQRGVFYLSYNLRNSKIQRNVKIGRYGDFSLEEARKKAIQYRREVQEGEDPMANMQAKIKKMLQEEVRKMKVKDLLVEYTEKYSKVHKKESSQRSDSFMIKNHIGPRLGEFAITDLDLERNMT